MHHRNEQPTPFMAIVALHLPVHYMNAVCGKPSFYLQRPLPLLSAHLHYCFFAKDKGSLLHAYLRKEFIIVISSSISFPLPKSSPVVNLLLLKNTHIYIIQL